MVLFLKHFFLLFLCVYVCVRVWFFLYYFVAVFHLQGLAYRYVETGQHLKLKKREKKIDGFGELLLLCFMPMSISLLCFFSRFFSIDTWHFWCSYCETTGSCYLVNYDTKYTLHIVMAGSVFLFIRIFVVVLILVHSLHSKVHSAHFTLLSTLRHRCYRRHRCRLHCVYTVIHIHIYMFMWNEFYTMDNP